MPDERMPERMPDRMSDSMPEYIICQIDVIDAMAQPGPKQQ